MYECECTCGEEYPWDKEYNILVQNEKYFNFEENYYIYLKGHKLENEINEIVAETEHLMLVHTISED